ncbi:L,D-transpeptidase [Marinobacter daepoensis]|uniref:L,D-transpeptidase n=1 Tax=Marinobacter daepoensis TaxID=262077 RepID=UPI001C96B0D9|nr:L,D-transpeptidase [Marinobacter daepoensis]MBY6031778.1 L,D-transpeptidase [Marinobacter daepoensis]
MPDSIPPGVILSVDIASQSLTLTNQGGEIVARYPVSTGLNGPGQADGSGCTPLGDHYVRARIGAGEPVNTVFRGRRPTGEVYSPGLAEAYPERDWILTRILWLCGCEWGQNRGPGVDTFRRYIYIHGTPDSEPMGVARSHGCIRMRNADIVELFDRVPAGTHVRIS